MPDLDRRRQIVGYAKSLPVAHRVVVVVAALVALGAGFMFFRWVSEPSWSIVASGLAGEDVSEVTTALDDVGIESRVGSGNNVEVRRADRFDANAALEDAGIMSAGELGAAVGNEILDDQGFSVTEDLQQVNIRRALEGELGRTISAMEFVERARVALVLPEVALFDDRQAPVQASVALELASTPTMGDIDAVVLFVAGAVEGLEPAEVTVVDTSGRVWNAPNTRGGQSAEASANLDYQAQVEAALEAEVRGLLDQLGVQHDVVVTAELNFDTVETEDVIYTAPGGGEAALSLREQSQVEDVIGGSPGPEGVPGVDGGAIEVGEDGDFTYTNEVRNVENVVDSRTVRQVQATGTIQTTNVAIAIDDGSLTGATVPTTAQVVSLVRAGLGLDPENDGDQIAVEAYPFAATDDEDLVTAAGAGGFDLVGTIVQAVGALALLVAIVALFLLSRRRTERAEAPEAADAVEVVRALDPPTGAPHPLDTSDDQLRSSVVQLVRSKPDDVAGLLRGWLNDR